MAHGRCLARLFPYMQRRAPGVKKNNTFKSCLCIILLFSFSLLLLVRAHCNRVSNL